jgi:hypothetical protein
MYGREEEIYDAQITELLIYSRMYLSNMQIRELIKEMYEKIKKGS